MHPLDVCRAKVDRARLHIGELIEGVQRFTQRPPYKLQPEIDEATNEVVFVARADPEFPPVPVSLALIAGEVAHQLRSSLDHLVWQLVIAHTGQPPQRTKTQFPIFETEAGYNQRAPAYIRGVSEKAAMRIRAAQPFHKGPEAKCVLTWVVHELNNTDKHRIIPVTTTPAFVGYLGVSRPGSRPVDILPWQEHVRELLHDGMEVARVPISDGMDVNISVAFDVAFEQLAGLTNHPLTDVLVKAADYVSGLIESFADEFA